MLFQIKSTEKAALITIFRDFIKGRSSDEIRLRLKERCSKFGISCESLYRLVNKNDTNTQFAEAISDILNDLGFGGAPLHLMSVQEAQNENKFNCYIWDESQSQLTYLPYNKAAITIHLDSHELLEAINEMMRLKTSSDKDSDQNCKTLYLSASLINTLITMKSGHTPENIATFHEVHEYRSSDNLYEVLIKLENQYPWLSSFIDMVHQAKPPRNWVKYTFLATFIASLTGFGIYLKANFPMVKAWYEKTFPIVSQLFHDTLYLLSKTPLIGVVSSSASLFMAWYRAIRNSYLRNKRKLIILFLKTLEHTLPLVGYLLTYFAGGLLTPAAMILFITGSGIEIVTSIFNLLYYSIKEAYYPLPPATEYFSACSQAWANSKRNENLYGSLIKIAFNLLTTSAVVVWCVFPPSLVIALSCVAFSAIATYCKNMIVTNIKNYYAKVFETERKDLHDYFSPNPRSKSELDNHKLKHQNEALREQNEKLQEKVGQLEEKTKDKLSDKKLRSRSAHEALSLFKQTADVQTQTEESFLSALPQQMNLS